MAVVRIRLCDADRERYGVGDLELDTEAVKDLAADELEALERDMTMPIAPFVEVFESGPLSPAWVRRVAAWLAVRMSGVEQSWESFTPKVLRAEFERRVVGGWEGASGVKPLAAGEQEAEVRPPAGPSEGSSEAGA